MNLLYLRCVMLLFFTVCLPVCMMRAEKVLTDTLLMRLYDKAAALMGESMYDSAQYFFDKAFATSGVEQSPVYPILLNEQATLFIYRGENEKGFDMKLSVLPYLSQVTDLEKHISVYNDLGILYRRRHMQDSALYCYNKALDAALKYGDAGWLAHLNQNLSVLYFNIKRFADAEACIDRALEQVLKTDDRYVTFGVWQVRASIKSEVGKTDEAGMSIRQAWKLACADGGNPVWQMRCMPGLFQYFRDTGENDSIDYYLECGNRLLPELPESSIPVVGFIQARAKIQLNRKQYADALRDFHWLRAKSAGTDFHTMYEAMARCYKGIGMEEKAFAYMDSARMWTDSLVVKNLAEQMAQFEAKYRAQERELEISVLRRQALETEARTLKMGIGVSVLLLLVAGVLGMMRHKQKVTARRLKELKQEKELVSAQRYIEGLEVECKRFACELHDGIANELLGLQLRVASASDGLSAAELSESIGRLRGEVRAISHELMPPEFERMSFDDILSRYADVVTHDTGCKVVYHASPADAGSNIPPQTAYELYRIVQELAMNSVRHGGATQVDIRLIGNAGEAYRLEVTDNGTAKPAGGDGIGLRTVGERVKAIHGTFEKSETDEGGHGCILTFNMNENEQRD